jgi:UV DNA damage endonuclease
MLDAMNLGPEAVIVLHVGGVYDDALTSGERFVRRFLALPQAVRRRVTLENDDHRFGYDALRRIHVATGVPLVFDVLHHQVHNPAHEPWTEALVHALGTWPAGVTPKLHYSTPRTEMRALPGSARIKLPTWTEHSDFVNPFAFVDFLRATQGLPAFDVMLECKARDLAVFKLREDVARFAPQLAESCQGM